VPRNPKLESDLLDKISRLPRVSLACLPTPLMGAPDLAVELGHTRIFFKRDDLTGLPLSGNKTRMFEFSLGHAMELGATTVVACASAQSNYCRQLAVACAKLGLECHLSLRRVRGQADSEIQGNLLLDLLAGAHVELWDGEWERQQEMRTRRVHALRSEGKIVYETRSTLQDLAIETAAYVNCALELHMQLQDLNVHLDYLVCASGETTQAGLLLGAKYLGDEYEIIGFNPHGLSSAELISEIAHEAARLLEIDVDIAPEDVMNCGDYVGAGYGVPTEEGLQSIELLLRTEGILLDPIYTSKAMAGFIDMTRNSKLKIPAVVAFLHTGGFPTVFAYHDVLSTNLPAPRMTSFTDPAGPEAMA